jgi:hypothetical protein
LSFYLALWAIFSAQLWVDIAKGGEQNFSPGTSKIQPQSGGP